MSEDQTVVNTDIDVCENAEKFTKIFYETMDRNRKRVHEIYRKDACMVWNGNTAEGQDAIASFLDNLPPTEHTLKALDAQRVNKPPGSTEEDSFLVHVNGVIRVQNRTRAFTQSFMLRVDGGRWRIQMDRLRYMT